MQPVARALSSSVSINLSSFRSTSQRDSYQHYAPRVDAGQFLLGSLSFYTQEESGGVQRTLDPLNQAQAYLHEHT